MDSAAAAGGSRFVISSTEAETLAKSSSLISLLPLLVRSSLPLARPPISNFHVAAVGLSSDNRIFVGVNLEFPNAPLHHSVHAEQFLVSSLAAHSAGRLLAVAVSAAPCGHCRQFLQELRGPSDLRICVVGNDVAEFEKLGSMLPNPFGPFDLLDGGSPLLLEPIRNGLSLVGSGFSTRSNPDESCIKNTTIYENGSVATDANACNGYCEPNYSQLEIEALEAANRSHAPYSNCPSGVALMDHEGKIYKGSYTESAAHNPSLGPVQAAIVAYVSGGGGAYSDIVSGVLVEREGAVVRQEETAMLLLKLIAPKCELKVTHCRSD